MNNSINDDDIQIEDTLNKTTYRGNDVDKANQKAKQNKINKYSHLTDDERYKLISQTHHEQIKDFPYRPIKTIIMVFFIFY